MIKRCVPLEAAAEAVCNQSSVPPLIFQLPPKQGRRVLEEAQDTNIPPIYPRFASILASGAVFQYTSLCPKVKGSKILYSIFMEQAGCSAAFIHMKS